MLLTRLKLNYFGRFHNREIVFKPGINLIYGENEAGKSTVHAFIKGILFGIERLRGRGSASKEDSYSRYLPWDYPGAFGGSMDLAIGDKQYRLQRNFHTNDKSFTILDLSTGREVKLKEGLIGELIPGLFETTYRNTISMEQLKARTDAELAAQVRNYITNLSIAKSKEVNVIKAVSFLNEQKKGLEAILNTTELKSLQIEIEEGILREEKIDSLTVQLKLLMEKERERKSSRPAEVTPADQEETMRREQLPAILEKYHTYLELQRQGKQLAKQGLELRDKMSEWEAGKLLLANRKEEVDEAEKLYNELLDYDRRRSELVKESANSQTVKKRNLLISVIPSLTVTLFSLLLAGADPIGFTAAAIAVIGGAVCFILLEQAGRKKQLQQKDKLEAVAQQISARKADITEILFRNQVSSMEELSLKQEELRKHSYAFEHGKEQLNDLEHRKSETDDRCDILYDAIMKYISCYISVDELNEDSIQRLKEEISRRRQEELQKQLEINKLYEEDKLQIERLRWELSSMEGNEAQLLKNKEQFAELEQKRKQAQVELEAVKLALDTIQGLSLDIHDSFGRQLNQAVSDIIGEVTGQKYTDIKLDEKLDVKVGWNGDYIVLDRLSAGTIDQIYFAIRLAVADLLFGKEEVPLLLDDSFALYDDNRVKAAFTKLADRKQIIIFSCHKREQRLLKELEMPFHFIDLSC